MIVVEIVNPAQGMILNQIRELNAIFSQVQSYDDHIPAKQRFYRWKERTVQLLAEFVNAEDARKFSEIFSHFSYGEDPLDMLRNHSKECEGFLTALFEEIGKYGVAHRATAQSRETERVVTVREIIEGIDQLRKDLVHILESSRSDETLRNERVRIWTARAYERLKDWGFSSEAEEGFGSSSVTWIHQGVDQRAKLRDDKLNALRDDLVSHPEHYKTKIESPKWSKSTSARPIPLKANKVFLGHGRNKLWARVHMHLKGDLDLDVEVWESEPRAGKHNVDILEGLLASCTFAVIVATGEDTTERGEVRARQNVVHEIGLFQGRIGFEKVALLQQEGIEEFSNVAGLQVIPFPKERIEAAFYELDRMLKREGMVK